MRDTSTIVPVFPTTRATPERRILACCPGTQSLMCDIWSLAQPKGRDLKASSAAGPAEHWPLLLVRIIVVGPTRVGSACRGGPRRRGLGRTAPGGVEHGLGGAAGFRA